MKPGGFAGSILSVDLSEKTASTQPIDEDIARNYIGGLVIELDNFGLDMFEFFNIMEFAKKLTDSKIIQLQSNEPEIDVLSFHSMIAWAKKVAYREGTGDLLADGVLAAIERIGPAAEKHAGILIKGIKPYAGPGSAIPWDRFGTMELGQVLDPRGPHVGSVKMGLRITLLASL